MHIPRVKDTMTVDTPKYQQKYWFHLPSTTIKTQIWFKSIFRS